MGLFADRFGLCPFVLDGIEIGGIRRQVFPGVAGLAKGVLDVLPFVESGVVQDDHGGGRQLGQEDLTEPGEEDGNAPRISSMRSQTEETFSGGHHGQATPELER